MKGYLLGLYLFAAMILPLIAQEQSKSLSIQFAYYPDNHSGGDGAGFNSPDYHPLTMPDAYVLPSGDPGRELGSGWGSLELQGSYSQSIFYPFLQGNSALTKDNNLELQIKTNLSPVTLNLESKAVITPIAFLKFEAGAHMGTGWNMGFNGLGLNVDGTGNPETRSFPGIVAKGWLQGTFQFDLAALWPGDWHHVVLSTSHKWTYQMFSGAEEAEPWQYLADDGQNFNGFLYEASYITGYQIPDRKVNFIGFMVEPSRNLGKVAQLSPLSKGGWGSDFLFVNMGPLANLSLSENQSLLILLQAKNGPVYSEESRFNNYFINRSATGESYWYLNRLALVYNYSL